MGTCTCRALIAATHMASNLSLATYPFFYLSKVWVVVGIDSLQIRCFKCFFTVYSQNATLNILRMHVVPTGAIY